MTSHPAAGFHRLSLSIAITMSMACTGSPDTHDAVDGARATARGETREEAPRCIEGLPNPENVITRALLERGDLYGASLADPSQLLHVKIHPEEHPRWPTDWSTDAIRAELAAHLAPVTAKLKAHGIEPTNDPTWSATSLDVEVPARLVPEIYCWPEVLAFTLEDDYPIVNVDFMRNKIETGGSVEVESASPGGPPVIGIPLDLARRCFWGSAEQFEDSRHPGAATGPSFVCAQNMRTGDLFRFTEASPGLTLANGWRRCTSTEARLASAMSFCTPRKE